ncbi:hypothetical protein H4R99_002826 [Coemansia sp. RSA 1722]|nr:hypothetical protein LPJ57_005656 [Coemansia sp. RSA 486]KAJ2228331.1 hypothetical protein IWW45_006653 [Coemansia sp. RSA 485]KAJ2601951.1 hypothetical protein H4R99_002826 [Coemansia sp. RSA 1722]
MSASDYVPVEGASEAQNKLLEQISEKFHVNEEHLLEIANEVYEYIVNGLKTDDTDSQPRSLPCRVSYIKSGISQDIREAEAAEALALGMTINTSAERFKISSIKFVSGQPDEINKQIFYMPQGVTSPAQLFSEAATHVAQFINTHHLELPSCSHPLCLGVTIDLPLEENSKAGGRVICNSLACKGLFGNVDIARSMNSELIKQHLPIKVTATTNCVISTMVAAQRHFQQTCVALILNHGINASYYEKTTKIPKIKDTELGNSSALVAINTELARFGENSGVLKPTMWDHRIDRESSNTGRHIFEKLVADKYLGEIVRNLITDFMDARLIFPKDADVTMFSRPYSFYTSYMTIMEDNSDDLSEVGNLLQAGFNIDASLVDRQIVRALCKIVAMRAAKLVSAAVAGIIRRATEAMDSPESAVISISGQLTEMNQPYLSCTIETASSLVQKLGLAEPTFNVLGEDGYTVGAALSSLSK